MDIRPLLSVIIPAYNCKDLLDESAGSVLSQLPDNCELIIVDDGSSDGTAEKLKELYAEHKTNGIMEASTSLSWIATTVTAKVF